jgi:hypothetical protein
MINQHPESRFARLLKPFFDSIGQQCPWQLRAGNHVTAYRARNLPPNSRAVLHPTGQAISSTRLVLRQCEN